MATRRKQTRDPSDRKLGVALLSAGAAAIGLGATLAALLIRRERQAKGHPAPDLAPDAPAPSADARAPEHFRPDPTAVPTAEEREALRPATGPAPTLAADRGSVPNETQGAA